MQSYWGKGTVMESELVNLNWLNKNIYGNTQRMNSRCTTEESANKQNGLIFFFFYPLYSKHTDTGCM